MSTSTKKSASTPAKTEAPTPTPAKATVQTYRQTDGFLDALKSAKSLAKGNTDLTQPLALITHLAWKTPNGTVGWATGTTASVVAYANDIAVPPGTPIKDALDVAVKAATTAATDKPQKDAVAVIAKMVQAHSA